MFVLHPEQRAEDVGVEGRGKRLGRLFGDRPGDALGAPRSPDFYFEQDNPQWPAVATLELSMPELRITHALARETVAQELERIETDARLAVQAKGWRVLGPEKIATLSPFDRAKSWEPLRGRNPTFAVGRGQRDAFFEAVTVLHAFRKAYRAALEAWRGGVRKALFPAGTWFMGWAHRATIASS